MREPNTWVDPALLGVLLPDLRVLPSSASSTSVLPPFFGPGLCDRHGCLPAVPLGQLPGRSSTAGSDLSGGVVAEVRVGLGLVVGATISLDQDRGFAHREERLLLQAFVPDAPSRAPCSICRITFGPKDGEQTKERSLMPQKRPPMPQKRPSPTVAQR